MTQVPDLATAVQFACPECGGTRFVAFYSVTDRQSVTLWARTKDGDPDPAMTQYDGDVRMAEGSTGDDQEYQCVDCDWNIELPQTMESPYERLVENLLEIHRQLFPERYDDEAEMLMWSGDTLPELVASIEHQAKELGDERFKLEPPERYMVAKCRDGTRNHQWRPSADGATCAACGLHA